MAGMVIRPWQPIHKTALTELIGINETVAQNNFSKSVAVALPLLSSGELLTFQLVSQETGAGAVIQATGKLFVFDTDPTVTANDAALAVADWPTVIGIVDVAAGDWVADANGAGATIVDTPIAFHRLSTLYFVFRLTSADGYNTAAGDDEKLSVRVWMRIDS